MIKKNLSLILVAFVVFSTLSSAGELTVCPSGCDYTKIQDAIDSANPEDTIIVGDGTYTENVEVNKSLSIRSENGADKTVVYAADCWNPVFDIRDDYVNITGFTVTGANYSAGIYLYDVEHCKISNNNASDNIAGIWLSYSSNNILDNNLAIDNGNGIDLDTSSNNTLINNSISKSAGAITLGIYSSNNTLTNNILSENVFGFALAASSNNTLSDNIASNNCVGVYISYYSSDNVLIGNRINNSENWTEECAELYETVGIWIAGSFRNQLYDNEIYDNLNGIVIQPYQVPSNVSLNNIIYNNYLNNTRNVYLNNTGSNSWNTTKTLDENIIGGSYLGGNYWSDYSGEDVDDDGIGDTPYEIDENNIDYLPLVMLTTCKGDLNGDGVVSDFELLKYINLWVQGSVSDFDLLEAIDNWAAGCS